MQPIRVKICCIANADEAAIAVTAGADALGFVGEMPSGPGIVSDDQTRRIVRTTPPAVSTVALTSATKAAGIMQQLQACETDTVQVVQHIDPQEHRTLLDSMPHIKRLQVIHVEGPEVLNLIKDYEPWVDGFLLDSGRPSSAATEQELELGGTGRVHDWAISAEFVKNTIKPVFLAGGLTPANVGEAIGRVKPFGVDLCSGIRVRGQLDPTRLTKFMVEVRATQR